MFLRSSLDKESNAPSKSAARPLDKELMRRLNTKEIYASFGLVEKQTKLLKSTEKVTKTMF